jgi:hypothetical protein
LKTLLLTVFCIVAAHAHANEKEKQAARGALEAAVQARQEAMARETRRCPADQPVLRVVDLDRPGALAALKETNRAHFIRLLGIDRTRPQPFGEVWKWIHTQANACEVTLENFYKTSLPAQAVISFVLDDTRYTRTVYVDRDW